MMEQVIFLADTMIRRFIHDLICEEQQLQYYTHFTDYRVNLVAQYVKESESIISRGK